MQDDFPQLGTGAALFTTTLVGAFLVAVCFIADFAGDPTGVVRVK